MKKNTELLESGVEVYTSRIQELADEYIDTIDNPDLIPNPSTAYFNGMIKYISNRLFKHVKLDYSNIEELDNIWDIYTALCYKYNKYPTIIEFCLLINISRDTLHNWKNETTRNYKYYTLDGVYIKDIAGWKLNHPGGQYVRELSKTHSDTVKKWLTECENALLRGASEGGKVGCIFALKANYGYTETAPIPTINQNQRPLENEKLPQLDDSNCVKSINNSQIGLIESDG